MEKEDENGSKDQAQKIRNIAIDHIRKGCRMKIKSNLTQREMKLLKEIKQDQSIVIVPAGKGRAVVIEDRENYLMKMQDQLNDGVYVLLSRSEKPLLKGLHNKLIR